MNTPEIAYETACQIAEENLQKAVDCLMLAPAYMTYFGLFEPRIVKDENVTMRINCKGTGAQLFLEYNPYWMMKVNEPTFLAFCISVECLRVALHHCTVRRQEPYAVFKKASDYICSDDKTIISRKLSTFDAIAKIPSKSELNPLFKKHNIDPVEGFFLEKVFAMLLDKKQKETQESGGNGMPPCESKGQGGKGKGKNSNEDLEEAMSEYFSESEEAAKAATEGWEENQMLDEEVQEITRRLASDPKNWGSISGNLLQAIMVANTPKVDWKSLFRYWRGSIIDKYTVETRAKRNRRHGFELPGQRHLTQCRVLIAFDVSGSMSEDDISKGLSLIKPLMKHAEISYCYWDTRCSDFEKSRRAFSEYNTLGGGGTNPQCIVDKIAESKKKFDGILVFTDNGFTWEQPERGLNKYFIIGTNDCVEPPVWIRHFVKLEDIIKE